MSIVKQLTTALGLCVTATSYGTGAAADPPASCATAVAAYATVYNKTIFVEHDFEEAHLQLLLNATTATIDLLKYFGTADHCSGPMGTTLLCATADELLIEIDHQNNLSLEKWQNGKRPPTLLRFIAQFDALNARHTKACLVPNKNGQPT